MHLRKFPRQILFDLIQLIFTLLSLDLAGILFLFDLICSLFYCLLVSIHNCFPVIIIIVLSLKQLYFSYKCSQVITAI